jgi:hypothetical protein
MRRYGLAALVLSVSSVLAAPPAATKPAEMPPKPQPARLKVTVASVSGPAQKLLAGEGQKKWQALKAGEQLSELTILRTGLGAKVVLQFEDRGEVTVQNATKVGIAELRKEGDLAKARLGLKYGALRARVDATRGRNDFRIATPVATLSVRGSDANTVFLADSPNIVDAGSGSWQVTQTRAMPDGTQQTTTTQTLQGGESGNTSMVPPIVILVSNRTPRMADSFGITTTEQSTLTSNPTGRQANNTASGVGTGVSGTLSPPIAPPVCPNEPGYP